MLPDNEKLATIAAIRESGMLEPDSRPARRMSLPNKMHVEFKSSQGYEF